MLARERRGPLGVANNFLGLAWAATPFIAAIFRQRWVLAGLLAIGPLLVVAGMVLLHQLRPRARIALELNRALLGRVPRVPHERPSGAGAWCGPGSS